MWQILCSNKVLITHTEKIIRSPTSPTLIIIPTYMSDLVEKCAILNDEAVNTSDHLPVSLTLNLTVRTSMSSHSTGCSNVQPVFPKPKWHDDSFKAQYSEVMLELCDKISIVPVEEVAAKDAKTLCGPHL